MRLSIAAASLLLVSAVAALLTSPFTSSSSSAFARMLELVGNARTVTFKTHAELGGKPHMESKMMLLEPDWMREEISEGKNKTIHIHNLKQRKSLTLVPTKKEAISRSISTPAGARPKNVIEQIREVRETSAKLLGNEKIDGKDARKYRCDHPTGHYLIWVAADSDLPVKVEISDRLKGAKDSPKITMTDFEWNVPLDESLFTLDVPKGYSVEEVQYTDPLDPKNFIVLMKAYVLVNNNQFPEEYNALTVGSMPKLLDDPSLPKAERLANYRRKLSEALEHPEWAKLSEEEWKKKGREIGRTFAQGAVFLHVLAQTHEWHYVGKGIKLGEADKVVAWWAPKADGKNEPAKPESATVLFGDLHIETKPVAGLPREAK